MGDSVDFELMVKEGCPQATAVRRSASHMMPALQVEGSPSMRDEEIAMELDAVETGEEGIAEGDKENATKGEAVEVEGAYIGTLGFIGCPEIAAEYGDAAFCHPKNLKGIKKGDEVS